MGVWLPLAMADIKMMLTVLARLWAANAKDVDIPKRSECLESWCLPMMASSMKETEKEAEAMEMFNRVKRLAEKQKEVKKK